MVYPRLFLTRRNSSTIVKCYLKYNLPEDFFVIAEFHFFVSSGVQLEGFHEGREEGKFGLLRLQSTPSSTTLL